MATSTDRTVRDAFTAAIRAIAQTDLGFDDVGGNVKDYPLEAHHEEKQGDYLRAKVGGRFTQRAWAVSVVSNDLPFAMGGLTKRTYDIRIIGYYLKGVDGAEYNLLIDHALKIRGAVKNMSIDLSGTATLISSASSPEIVEKSGVQSLPLWEGTMTYTAERTNPDF